MHAFDYLSVFVSIIVALGVSHLLQSLARLIYLRDKITVFIPSLIWAFALLILQIQIWWASFYRRDIDHWSFFGFAFYLSIPVIISMLSFLLFPELKPGTDLQKDFYHNKPFFFGLLASSVAISLLEDLTRSGSLNRDANTYYRVVFLVVAIGGTIVNKTWMQYLLAAVFLTALLCYIRTVFSIL